MTDEWMACLAAAAAAVVLYILLPLARARLGEQRTARLAHWAWVAVQAAEQVFAGAGRGAEKKAYAEKLLTEQVKDCSPAAAEAWIEAAVYAVQQPDRKE